VQGLRPDTGTYDAKSRVDEYLRTLESKASSLDDGLRTCAARVGRAMYTLRNKRSVAHKGEVDPNRYDLEFLLHSAQWVLAEPVRSIGGSSIKEAGQLVAVITLRSGRSGSFLPSFRLCCRRSTYASSPLPTKRPGSRCHCSASCPRHQPKTCPLKGI
jgi:hypothetical protein